MLKPCAKGSLVHPLDGALTGASWQVVPVSDFDGEFKAKGTTKEQKKKSRKPPKLLEFKAAAPEYAKECRDEVTPGTSEYQLEALNTQMQELPGEHPCKLIGGSFEPEEVDNPEYGSQPGAPQKIKVMQTHGTTWKANDLGETVNGEYQSGITYDRVWQCAKREQNRDFKLAKQARHRDKLAWMFNYMHLMGGIPCTLIPNLVVAPLGAGAENEPSDICEQMNDIHWSFQESLQDELLSKHTFEYEEAISEDCDPLQLGMARAFCDLYCIKNAVKSGDKAILRSLEAANDIMGKNMKMLFEYYTGNVLDKIEDLEEKSSLSLEEESHKIHDGMSAMFTEMKSLASESSFDVPTKVNMMRAIDTFSSDTSSQQPVQYQNATDHIQAFMQRADRLHTATDRLHKTFMTAAEQKLSGAAEVEHRMSTHIKHMQKTLRTRTMMLGVYQSEADDAKRQREHIRSSWVPKLVDLPKSFDAHVTRMLLLELDEHWWDLRAKLDRYLNVAMEQVTAYDDAFSLLDSYTSQCSAGFSSLRQTYSVAMAAHRKAQEVLQETWSEAVPLIGKLAAKVVDGDAFNQFTYADTMSIVAVDLGKNLTDFCMGGAAARAAVRRAIDTTVEKGLVGQTMKQLRVAFLEMTMLRDRHSSLAVPIHEDVETVHAAWKRVREAYGIAMETHDDLAGKITKELLETSCS